MKLAVVGAGLLGRLLAWRAAVAGHTVHLFEKTSEADESNCSFAAAGMLTPYAELHTACRNVWEQGLSSLLLWKTWVSELKQWDPHLYFAMQGSVLVAHREDKPELQQFVTRFRQQVPETDCMQVLKGQALHALEPELQAFEEGFYFKEEAQVDVQVLMRVLVKALKAHGVHLHWETPVETVQAGAIQGDTFDHVFDCRGLAAKEAFPDLRGVRGELISLHAPEVSLTRPVRLMHPRYRLYIVPRPGQVYLVGATEIESEDTGPLTVRSALELLSAAFSVHRGFSEARILKTVTQVRPALPSQEPVCVQEPGLTRLNGLYRHGVLLSPGLVEEALRCIHETNFKETRT